MAADAPKRILPALDDDNRAYWTSGRDGVLAIHRCADCRYWVHPPVPFCPACESRNVAPEAASGRGTIATFTINHKQWVPGLPVPYVLALVALDEQDDVRLACNITHCDPDEVEFGMPVKVWFEQHEDLWIPFFRPAASRP